MNKAAPQAVSFDAVRDAERPIASSAPVRPAGATAAQESLAGEIDRSPARSSAPAAEPPPLSPESFGLALSGGGIRSATFSLGVVQALATAKVLERMDYLSTVSGGGYLGSFLTAWIHRSSLKLVQAELGKHAASGFAEPVQVQWLRRYSNYLTPRVGALSLDALTVAATWLRNVLLNLIVLVSFVAFVFLIPIAVLVPLGFALSRHPEVSKWLALALAAVSLSSSAVNLMVKNVASDKDWPWLVSPVGVLVSCVATGVMACFFGSFWLVFADFKDYSLFQAGAWILAGFAGIVLIAGLIGRTIVRRIAGKGAQASGLTVKAGSIYFVCGAIAICLGAGLLWLAQHHLPVAVGTNAADLDQQMVSIITCGPPLLLLVFALCLSVWIGLVGRVYYEPSREWWSRTGGALLMASAACLVWFIFAFYVPSWVATVDVDPGAWNQTIKGVLTASWLGTLLGALGLTGSGKQSKSSRPSPWKEAASTVLASLFALGLFVLIALLVHGALNALAGYRGYASGPYPNYWGHIEAWRSGVAGSDVIALLAFALIAGAFGWRVDVNRFSLHNMYKNRIIRCYLGASNSNRRPQPFTGFDTTDDLPLAQLKTTAKGEPQRPFHIVNTAMNLVQGSELAWQQRKATSFVLTPTYCGFAMSRAQGDRSLTTNLEPMPGFQPTDVYACDDPGREEQGFSLGMAIATSGAAASPNMGANTQPALAVLMTFFDIRLGRWSPNPAGKTPRRSSPRFGLMWLLSELMGFTNERRNFVYLSDGGHFENMAIYELVRRRCTKIIAVDAGADPERSFEDLGNMLRKCRVDLDTQIDVDLKQLYAENDGSGRSKRGFVLGQIHYPKYQGVAEVGQLLIIKPTLLHPPSEPADIFNYASATAFPQESTADQWFDESQFESYRSLGCTLATSALEQFGHLFKMTGTPPEHPAQDQPPHPSI